jgi:uncharacterized protein
VFLAPLAAALTAEAVRPSFFCEKASSPAEQMICADDELAKLDSRLAMVYASALVSSPGDSGRTLEAEQRVWKKERDESWKHKDQRAFIKSSYEHRISELQVGFGLVKSRGPFALTCDGNPASRVVMTFFESVLPTARADRGDRSAMLFASPSGSGARYEGQGVSYWEHQGDASITWGDGAKEMKCKRIR